MYNAALAFPIRITNKEYDKVVFKKNINSHTYDSKSVEVFIKLKDSGIPTFDFMCVGSYANYEFLIMENLNFQKPDIIYVSSNYHEENPILLQLSGIKGIGLKSKKKSMEFFLSHNKLVHILNIDEALDKGMKIAKNCLSYHILFAEDSVFFGVNIKKQTIDDIILGDYGSILIDTDIKGDVNINAINTAFDEFKMHFVEGKM